MGISIGVSRDGYTEEDRCIGGFSKDSYSVINTNAGQEPVAPNPNPGKFKIRKFDPANGNVVVLINYEGCTNYEGNKILVYENLTIEELRSQGLIDPHFSENEKYRSPFARFEPTTKGWIKAVLFARNL